MTKRSRPKVEDMENQHQHSYDHRGDTGKYGNIYNKSAEVQVWWPAGSDKGVDHEFCIIPYLSKKNSIFRTKNPDFNMPFSDKVLEEGKAWSHKLTVLIHGSIGANRDNVVCPRTFKEPCPICEDRDRLIKESDDSKAMQEQIRLLSPAKRAIYNVFIFDSKEEMEKGIQVWEAPHQSMEDTLSELYVDRRTGEKKYFTIPEEGWNICFEKRKENPFYRRLEILERKKQDEFTDKEIEQLYDMSHNLEEVIDIKTYEELKEMHFGPEEEGKKEEREEKTEEKSERTSRFRRDEKEEEKPEDDNGIPEEYKDCFGIQNGELEKCEDCPKKIWEECYKKCEETKKPPEKESGRRRDIGR